MARTVNRYTTYLVFFVFVAAATMLAGELFVRAFAGPPAYFLFTGSFRDVQTDWDNIYGVDEGNRRTSCVSRSADAARRIAVIGDSFVFGQGVADCQDFVSLLGGRLEDVRLDNYGLIGVGLPAYLAIARDLLDSDYTDVLVVFYGNDVSQHPLSMSLKGRLAEHSAIAAMLRKLYRSYLVGRALDARRDVKNPVTGTPATYNNIESILTRQDRAYFRHVVDPPAERQRPFAAMFDEFAGVLKERVPAGKVTVMVVPDGSTVSGSLRQFIIDAGGEVAAEGSPGSAAELIRELAGKHGFVYLDIFPAVLAGGDKVYFPHDLHWSQTGHSLIADELQKYFVVSDDM